ncbi:MAG: hypothetical protein KC419_04445 [Anaerolineales bacterium]|nr:hypothetical protein [Anaerolineales bacterium]MCA9927697.1 hypothetical protein [Anaerolineales bacterium]
MNRLEWILGVMLVVLLLVVAVLSLLFWFRPDPSTADPQNSATVIAQRADDIAPTSVFEGQTAKLAFVAARRAAESWQPDAQLLNASATWPQGATIQELLGGETTWGFTFYSPEGGKTAVISVVENNPQLIGEAPTAQTYTPIDITSWELDSNEAIQRLLEAGGSQFIQDEGVTILTMLFAADNLQETNQLEWLVSLISTQNGRSIDMRLNAITGEVIELSQIQ